MGRHSSEEDGAQPDGLDAGDVRDRDADEFWDLVGVDPVEIALTKGVGYTLRAYVPVEDAEEDEDTGGADDEEDAEADESGDETASADEDAADENEDGEEDASGSDEDDTAEDGRERGRRSRRDDGEEEEEEDDEDVVLAAPVTELADADLEEAPRFLTADGRLLLFETPEALAEFIRTDRDHDLAGLESWDALAEGVKPEWIVPAEEDAYELDLVVGNLRGGHDEWEPELIISAGELARDLAYALRLKSVLTALAPGSPIDDLDDALRAAEAGGVGGFFAKRRLRRIGAQQASLAWRSIIGKISASVDWRK